MSESLTLYKLIILYMLRKVSFPLTNAQISDFILEKEYTTYFTLQQAISELIDSNLIKTETIRNSSRYYITEEGDNTLVFFENRISDAIKADIDEYLEKNKYDLRNEVSTISDYYKTTNNEYAVRCQVKEKHSDLVDLTLTVPDEEEAAAICNNWQKKSQQIYAYLMGELMV
jgi:DNA-binding PadR family transcriptional regulator